MSSVPPDNPDAPSGDDTAAFQRYYLGGDATTPEAPARGLAYRLLIGWWRDR